MRILTWIGKLRGIRGHVLRKSSSCDYREPLFPDLFVRQLEERRVLSGTPLSPHDGTEGITLDAGAFADDGNADTFQVVRQRENVDFSVNGNLVHSAPLAAVQRITVKGSGDDDVLIVDFSGEGIDTLTYRFDRIGEGSIQVAMDREATDGGTVTLAYAGVETVHDASVADSLVFQLAPGTETATISDDGDADDGESMIRSNQATAVTFAAPVSGSVSTGPGGQQGHRCHSSMLSVEPDQAVFSTPGASAP